VTVIDGSQAIYPTIPVTDVNARIPIAVAVDPVINQI